MLLLAAIILAAPALAFDVLAPTELFYVADYAGVLERDTIEHIVGKNDVLYNSTGAQICVVTVDFIGDAGIEDYAYKLFNDWGIGSAEKNNGVLLLLVIGAEDYYCMQGKGIEKNLSSGELGDILYEYLEPDFAAKNYDDGVRKVFDALESKISTIYLNSMISSAPPMEYYEEPEEETGGSFFGGLLSGFGKIIFIIVIILLVVILSSGRRGGIRRVRPFIMPPPPFGRMYRRPPMGGFNHRTRPAGFTGGSRPSGRGGFSGPRSGGGGASRGGGAGRR